MLNSIIAKGNMARLLSSLCSTAQGRVSCLLEFQGFALPERDAGETQDSYLTRPKLGDQYEGDYNLMCQLLIKLVESASRFHAILSALCK